MTAPRQAVLFSSPAYFKTRGGAIVEQEDKRRELRQKAMRLPLSPGVYLMHNKAGEIIYIG